jgi:hypothetical protein
MLPMNLPEDEAFAKLAAHDHAILCTVHSTRGVDGVPVAYAVRDVGGDRFVGIPIDRVKPKASLRLQRERNLEADPRATLLAEHWDSTDWTKLWWVRAEMRWQSDSGELEDVLASALAARYPQYRDHPFERILVLQIVGLTGWSAS